MIEAFPKVDVDGVETTFTAVGYETSEELADIYQNDSNQPFCAALTFNKFDIENLDFEIEFNFGKT